MKAKTWKSIRLPLGDKSYLQDVYVFVFRTEDGFMMLDAGLNTKESFETLLSGLRDLGYELVQLKKLVISHYHLDHCGLALRLQQLTSAPVYLHENDRRILLFFKEHIEEYPEKIKDFFCSYGVPEKIMKNIVNELYVYKALLLGPTETIHLKDGALFPIEDGYLKVIHTPGHTPGHVSLFHTEEKVLFGADFLVQDEWPHGGIYPHTASYNPIGDYLKSLEKVKSLEPELIIPSHKEPIYEPVKKIDEAISFMKRKIEEIYDLLKKGPLSLAQICDMAFKGYESSLSYFFLLSVGLGYMRYLIEKGLAEEVRKEGLILFGAK